MYFVVIKDFLKSDDIGSIKLSGASSGVKYQVGVVGDEFVVIKAMVGSYNHAIRRREFLCVDIYRG